MASAATDQLTTFAGERSSGKDVQDSNAMAVEMLANVLKTSFGPQGLDKMLVDNIGEVLVTNDGATILQHLEVQHVAAKILVDLSQLQDKEAGDGTTSVVLLAAELVRRGNALIRQGVHPSIIIAGFRHACKESVAYLQKNLSHKLDSDPDANTKLLKNVAATSLSSKVLKNAGDHFVNIVVEAIKKVRYVDDLGNIKYPVAAVGILKVHGRSLLESSVVDGMAISHIGRASQGMPKHVKDCKIALIDFGLKQHRMYMGVNMLVDNPEELEKIRLKEKDICRQRVKLILDSGANVVFSSQGIDDMALKYFVESNAFAVRRVSQADMKRISVATGARRVLSMVEADSAEEVFNPSWLGKCASVDEERIGDWDCVFVRGCPIQGATAIVLRGANDFLVDEAERCVHDALCALSKALQYTDVCVGGGAVETALSTYLSDVAQSWAAREQLAVAEFAEALLCIPKILATNSAGDAAELVSLLRAHHVKSQRAPASLGEDVAKFKDFGLDLTNGKIRNNFEAGVLEPTMIKIKLLRFATEAATTILRIDDFIKLEPEKAPEN